MGLFRDYSDITKSFGKDNAKMIDKVLGILGVDELPKKVAVDDALFRYQRHTDNPISSIFDVFTEDHTSGFFSTEDPKRPFRLEGIGSDYNSGKIDLETANAKILCEGLDIDTSKFDATNAETFNTLAILKAQGFDVSKFADLGPNQLESLKYIASDKYGIQAAKGEFLLGGMKDLADKSGSFEIELENGDIVSVEKMNFGYKYFKNGEDFAETELVYALSKEDLDKNTIDNVLSENEFYAIVRENTKELSDLAGKVFVDILGNWLFAGTEK